MRKIWKRIISIEDQLTKQDGDYNLIQNRYSKVTAEMRDLKSIVDEIEKELEKVKKVIKNGRNKC